MKSKLLCLLLVLTLALLPAAVAESDVAAVDADGVHFLSAGSVETAVSAESDGLYLLLLPVTAPLLTSQQQMWQLCHLCSSSNLLMVADNVVTQQVMFSGDAALLPEEISVSARPGLTEYAFRLVELSAGEYALTLDNLSGGETDSAPGLYPAVRKDALSEALSAAESRAYAIPLEEDASITFALSGEAGDSVVLFCDAAPDRKWQLTIPDGEAEISAALELSAGEIIVYFAGDSGSLTAQ